MKTAVITGATKGLGKAIALKFLENGFNIAVCARSEMDLYRLKKEGQEQYPDRDILALPVDMRDTAATKEFAEKINQRFPQGVDVLVNNAGIFQSGNIADEPEGRLEEMMNLNVLSAYHLTRSLLPAMMRKNAGHIFNMCSVASLQAYPNGGSYSISKYALLGFSENLRYELREKNIKVTAVMPGAVWTDSWKDSGVAPERLMSASDIAEMVWAAYSLSPRAAVENIIIRPQLGDL
ncbi:MAG TPA: SDR family oxidoreductase [Edaphocola sp.]|nr:SDR family oxidoreductase [Edaphocola sp.]